MPWFCSSRMSRGPFEVTLTGGSAGAFDQNAHGQMSSGMPSLSGHRARAAAVAVA